MKVKVGQRNGRATPSFVICQVDAAFAVGRSRHPFQRSQITEVFEK